MNIINKINVFLADENGAETVEWVIVAAGIAAVAVAIYSSGTGTLKATLNSAMNKISNAIGGM